MRITTTKGQELILMRLSDAVREVGDTPGAQVHRSHWVSYSQVTAARREGDRAILTLSDGQELPVSRANVAKIKEAGLLPR
ncbi:LytTR family DNA-binding domain-containing protein [Tropicibacter naphthalenivorans]|uniref:LytTR family DNA-binding domain-containing protein n=1 Tax=Tropicibacter naphthalenivorans TaxID=441103 RepID=UPI00071D402E|nr:LytTR family DNA-binding domain-containing protein [Tropicibacter naphthalenivorans]